MNRSMTSAVRFFVLLLTTATTLADNCCGVSSVEACIGVSNVSCVWSSARNLCQVKKCEDELSTFVCESSLACRWNTSVVPARCQTAGAPLTCSNFAPNVTVCEQVGGCAFDSSTLNCYNSSEPLPCGLFNISVACPTPRCAWNTSSLVCAEIPLCSSSVSFATIGGGGVTILAATTPSSGSIQTTTAAMGTSGVSSDGKCCGISPSTCNSVPACAWSYVSNVCRNKTCSDVYDTSSCSMLPGCNWSSTIFQCAPSDIVPCSSFFSAGSCPSPFCAFDSATYACYNLSLGVPCGRFYSPSTCPDNRCAWISGDFFMAMCAEVTECNGLANYSAPNTTLAAAVNTSIATSTVVPGTTAVGLQGTCCGIILSTTCMAVSGCSWGYSNNVCRNKTCADVFDAFSCSSFAAVSCIWNSTTFQCRAPGLAPCSTFYSFADCPADYCTYNTSRFICHDMAGGLPCGQFYDELDCPSPRCLWLVPSGYGQCFEAPACAFNYSAPTATSTSLTPTTTTATTVTTITTTTATTTAATTTAPPSTKSTTTTTTPTNTTAAITTPSTATTIALTTAPPTTATTLATTTPTTTPLVCDGIMAYNNVSGATVCANVTLCQNTTQWLQFSATPTSDAICRNVTNCSLTTQYRTAVATPSSNTVCANATVCALWQYQLIPLTLTANRLCRNITVCKFGEIEVLPPTLSSDRVCTMPARSHNSTLSAGAFIAAIVVGFIALILLVVLVAGCYRRFRLAERDLQPAPSVPFPPAVVPPPRTRAPHDSPPGVIKVLAPTPTPTFAARVLNLAHPPTRQLTLQRSMYQKNALPRSTSHSSEV